MKKNIRKYSRWLILLAAALLLVIYFAVPAVQSAVNEAMAILGREYVIPAYYDVALKTRDSRDEESAEMIDIIRDSLTFDLGYLCSTSLNGLGHLFVNLVRNNSTDLASKYASSEKAAQTALEEMLAAYGYNG